MPPDADRPDPDLTAAVREVLGEVAAAGDTVTYAELVERLPALERLRETDGLGPVLRRVSEDADAAGRGLLSAVVVRSRGEPLPSAGFFRLAAELGRDVGDRRACWRSELDRVFATHRD